MRQQARDDRVAVASARPYTNHFHLAADRNDASTSTTSFLKQFFDVLPDAQPTTSKQ